VDQEAPTITVATWNLQGSNGVDVSGVASVLGDVAPDILVLQEVGWSQSRHLARHLGMQRRWAFKHLGWPWPEGLAVLTPHRIVRSDRFVIRRQRWWDWRRRIAIHAEIDVRGRRVDVIDVHLSPHDHAEDRRREAARVVAVARALPRLPLIAGDCNDVADGPGPGDFRTAGWVDAWELESHSDVDGSTNWTAGDRRGRPPTQRLDYIFVPPGWTVADSVVGATADRFDWFAERSDHLPVSATVVPPATDG
jgi:endonuclease/exonuclease/phosphatase family metal-dependent hydrolase